MALPCGSRSTSSTRRFIATRLAARLTAVVVLPTPPFWLATAMMRVIGVVFPSAFLRCMMTRWRAASSPGTASDGVASTTMSSGSCASSSSGCTPFIANIMPRGARCARGRAANVARSENAREITMSNGACGAKSSTRTACDSTLASPSSIAACVEKRGLLVIGVDEHDVPVGPRDRERNARNAAARADVEHAQSARCAGKMRQHRERVEQMMRDHALRFADRGQVVRLVPLGEQREVGDQLRALRIASSARPSAAMPRQVDGRAPGPAATSVMPTALRAPRPAVAAPRFRWTSNSEIAAGVMPEMRAAWPIVSGLCSVELLLRLGRQAAHVAVVEVRR